MDGRGEILTVQVGAYANNVATTMWNSQAPSVERVASALRAESLSQNADTHIITPSSASSAPSAEESADAALGMWKVSEGSGSSVRISPRALVIDRPGKWGKLGQDGVVHHGADDALAALIEAATRDAAGMGGGGWGGMDVGGEAVQVVQAGRSSGPHWSDRMAFEYSSRALHELVGGRFGGSPFDAFVDGRVLLDDSVEDREALSDSFYRMAEGCDSLRGIQVLANTNGGYGGFAFGLIEMLADDLPKSAVTLYSTVPAQDLPSHPLYLRRAVERRALNEALLVSSVISSSISLCVPFSVPKWATPIDDPYVSAPIIGRAIDALSLGYRTSRPGMSMAALAHGLAATRMLRIGQVAHASALPDTVTQVATQYGDSLRKGRRGTQNQGQGSGIELPLVRLYELEAVTAATAPALSGSSNPLGLSLLALASQRYLGTHGASARAKAARQAAASSTTLHGLDINEGYGDNDDDDDMDVRLDSGLMAERDLAALFDSVLAPPPPPPDSSATREGNADPSSSSSSTAGASSSSSRAQEDSVERDWVDEEERKRAAEAALEALVGKDSDTARSFVSVAGAYKPYSELVVTRAPPSLSLWSLDRFLQDSYLGYSSSSRLSISSQLYGGDTDLQTPDLTHLFLSASQGAAFRDLNAYVRSIETVHHIPFLDADFTPDDWSSHFDLLQDVSDAYTDQ